ncbi:MAG: glycine cleavage system protein GcvH [Negativicutes bacterium]|nr:glycine cleavage system protein GcvH [Negativicutes bacterium]
MNIPQNLLYSKSHEWVLRLDETTVRIGITDMAQQLLGDLVYINLPEVGDAVTSGETFSDVESVKAVSDIFSPVTGEISAVNEELRDHPQLMNSAPYEAWIIEVKNVSDREELFAAEQYAKICAEEEGH